MLKNEDIDIIVGNFSGVLGSAGGFCAGSEAVIDHQAHLLALKLLNIL